MEQITGRRVQVIPNRRGGLPGDVFVDHLGVPLIWIPHSYNGCKQHGPNEHFLRGARGHRGVCGHLVGSWGACDRIVGAALEGRLEFMENIIHLSIHPLKELRVGAVGGGSGEIGTELARRGVEALSHRLPNSPAARRMLSAGRSCARMGGALRYCARRNHTRLRWEVGPGCQRLLARLQRDVHPLPHAGHATNGG